MFNLVQHSPGEVVLLSNSESRERLEFQLENKRRFLPRCNFEILTTEELLIAEQEANEELIEEYASANAY